MKQRIFSQATFFGKSLLWSLMLYIVAMMALNWEEVTHVLKKDQMPVVKSTAPAYPDGGNEPEANISANGTLMKIQTFTRQVVKIAGLFSE